MKHYAWKEENKRFSLPACTRLCYRVTVFITSPRGSRKLWCTDTYLAALKMEGGMGGEKEKKNHLSDFRNTHTKAHTSPPSKTVTEVVLHSCCSTWRRTPASPPAGHLVPYLGTIPVLPSTFPYTPARKSLTACHCLSSPQGSYFQIFVVAEQAKTHGGRDGSKKSTEQPCQ